MISTWIEGLAVLVSSCQRVYASELMLKHGPRLLNFYMQLH